MKHDHQSIAQVRLLFSQLQEMKSAAEQGIPVDQEERVMRKLSLVRLLDEIRPSGALLPAFSDRSRAYLSHRTHSLIPEKELIDWASPGLRETGLAQVQRTAFVLMAAGAGSRLEALRDEEARWTDLGLGDLHPSDFDHFSKATAPLGPVSKYATTELLLQSILAVARQSGSQVPVVLSYDNKAEFRIREIAERWRKADGLLIYLKKESFGLPAIANDGSLLLDGAEHLVVGSGGPGGSLRALGEPEFTPLQGKTSDCSLIDHFHVVHPHIDTLCYLQTDMPSSPKVLLAVLGAKRRKRTQVSLAAYDYPPGFQLGVVCKWTTPKKQKGFEIVDFADRTPAFDRLLQLSQESKNTIPDYSGLMAFDLELGAAIVKEGLFRPEIHWNKRERGLDGRTLAVNKVVLSLTDVAIEADTLSGVLLPAAELLPGKTPAAFAQCRQGSVPKGQSGFANERLQDR